MSTLAIGWTNRARTGTFTASSAADGLGPDNLQSDHGSSASAWQTEVGVTAADLVLDGGAGATWGACSLHRTNLTSGATTRWRLSDDPAFGTAIEDSGTLADVVADGFGQAVWLPAAEVTARYLRLDVEDAANPQGLLSIPLLFAGPVWRPLQQWGADSAESAAAEIVTPVTRGGQEFPELRWRRRLRLVSLPLLDRSERWTEFGEFERAAADGRNVLLVPAPESDLLRGPVYGPARFDGVGYAATSPYRFRATRFTVTERL